MLFKKQNALKEVQKFQTKEVKIIQKRYQNFQAQIDGEFHVINSNSISISVLERNLNVIA
jgi:mannose-1-phosphate guanylyltransferase